MRPLDTKLRERYAIGVAALKSRGMPVTKQALADELGLEYDAVRTFCNRNPKLMTGLEIRHRKLSSASDYVGAVLQLRQEKVKVTHEAIAKKLGRDRTSVTRFLGEHPEVLALVNKDQATQLKMRPKRRKPKAPPASAPAAPKPVVEKPPEQKPTPVIVPPESKPIPPVVELSQPTKAPVIATPAPKLKPIPLAVSAKKQTEVMPKELAPKSRFPSEFTLRYFDENVQRFVLGKVSRREYIQLWNEKRLDFQLEGKPKPPHLPTPKELVKD